MIDVACVCIGEKYNLRVYVQQLYRSVKRHLRVPFRFNVITDDPNNQVFEHLDIRVIESPQWNFTTPDTAWWYKMFLFSEKANFADTVLYFDLDVLILNDITKFIEYKPDPDKFWICQDFNRQFAPMYQISNSSVMRWNPAKRFWMYHEFIENMDQIVKKHRGDQDLISAMYRDRSDKMWWPREWAMSYKWEILHGGLTKPNTTLYNAPDRPYVIPSDTSVIVYHGRPDPHDTKLGREHFDPDLWEMLV